MIQVLHYPTDPKLWELLWYIPSYGFCRIYIINRSSLTPKPKTQTLNPKPYSLNPKPYQSPKTEAVRLLSSRSLNGPRSVHIDHLEELLQIDLHKNRGLGSRVLRFRVLRFRRGLGFRVLRLGV